MSKLTRYTIADAYQDRILAQVEPAPNDMLLNARTIAAHMERIGQPLPGGDPLRLQAIATVMRRGGYTKLPTSRGVQLYGDYANAAWRGVRLKS